MALNLKLDAKLTQKLALTPQLQQAIKLLQLPQLDLIQAINQELQENPFLEESTDEAMEVGTTTVQEENPEPRTEETSGDASSQVDDTEWPDEIPTTVEKLFSYTVDDYFEDRASDGRDVGYFTPGVEESPSFEQFARKTESLYEHLTWQLNLLNIPDDIRDIAHEIIGNLDEMGYLRLSEEAISEMTGAPVEKVREAIKAVQSLDPPGIGARDLRECLLIQLREMNLGGTLVEKIVSEDLELLRRHDYKAIAEKHNCTEEDVLLAYKIISELEPKPARNFYSHETNYIVPDVFVERDETGEFRIILNEEGFPRLRLNSYYRRLLQEKDKLSKDEKKFLMEKLRSAVWLMKTLDQRNRTIYKVTESIVKFQREFFEKGPQFLKPLNLRDVAEDIGMHESTISRVTLNKYLSCEHGIFPFRHFFSTAIKTSEGVMSNTLVKDMIRQIIEEENPQKPYSDSQIVEILKTKGIKIARRTVAKYREEMKIPSHNERKRLKTRNQI
ncbi:MAG: RNA polymerase sigma-54 factor [Nitrospirae bacterium]|nr:MAG: RNA polymerase sigma-54 factor [Nitrospirota bacterium]